MIGLAFPVVLLVVGLLYAVAKGGKGGGRPKPSGEQPIGPGAESLESLGGVFAFKRPIAEHIIASSVYAQMTPTEQPNVFLMVQTLPPRAFSAAEGGAYFGLRALHAEGYVIWIPTLFASQAEAMARSGVFVVALPPREKAPADYAVLIFPDERFPDDSGRIGD